MRIHPIEEASRHRCLIYEGSPAEQSPVIVDFIRQGLTAGGRALCLGAPEMLRKLELDLAANGVAVGELRARGALVLTSERPYLDGPFKPAALVEMVIGLTRQAIKDGFTGLFATGDMAWEMGNDENLAHLLQYEALLENAFEGLPLTGICQYPRKRLPGRAVRDALLTHQAVHVGNDLWQDNVFYVPPTILLNEPTVMAEDQQGEWMWRQIRRSAAQARKAARISALARSVDFKGSKESEHHREMINRTLLGLGENGPENIRVLTALAGRLLGADAAIYRRLRSDRLWAAAVWGSEGDVPLIEELRQSPWAGLVESPPGAILTVESGNDAHPARAAFGLCVAVRVGSGPFAHGVLCINFRARRRLTDVERRTLTAVAVEISQQEERLALATSRRRLEESLIQAQKMEAIGRLAGGIAHDFNNALTAIQGHAQLVAMSLSDEKHREDLTEIIRASKHAAQLTKQLLAFSRKQISRPSTFPLAEAVDEAVRLSRRLLGVNVKLEVRHSGNGWVRMDRTHVAQILMNLIVNARDAMPDGGKITVQTREDLLAPAGQGAKDDTFVVLSVADTGTGMDEATAGRLFEPYFSTKGQGEGSGLGLSIVQGLVSNAGGEIRVSTEPGKGTTFLVYFPRESPGRSEAPEPGALGTQKKRRGRVLIVEDQDATRRMLEKSLEIAGFSVISAESAESALTALGNSLKPLDLVVTDLVMTGKSGHDLARELKARLPRLKVLLISGFAGELLLPSKLDDGVSYLAKPFGPSELLARIDELLS